MANRLLEGYGFAPIRSLLLLIGVVSVMGGFSTKLKDRLHKLLSDVVIEAHGMDIDVAKYVAWKRRIPLFQVPTALSVNAAWGHRSAVRVDGVVQQLAVADVEGADLGGRQVVVEDDNVGSLGFDGPCVYANFVETLDGIVSIPTLERSNALVADESDDDKFLMGILRALADVPEKHFALGAIFQRDQAEAKERKQLFAVFQSVVIILAIIFDRNCFAQIAKLNYDLRIIFLNFDRRYVFNYSFDFILYVRDYQRVIGGQVTARLLDDRRMRHVFVVADLLDCVDNVVGEFLRRVVHR